MTDCVVWRPPFNPCSHAGLQHWYWHPYLHFISLSLAPTCVIGLNKDLALPASFSVTCLSKPSDFAYVSRSRCAVVLDFINMCLRAAQPAPLEDKKEEKKERVQTVELSTTAKARAKAKAKGGDDSTMVDATPVAAPAEAEEKKLAEEKCAFCAWVLCVRVICVLFMFRPMVL